jgi:hypothetical protein
MLARAQVGAGQRVGVAQFVGRAVEHDLAALLAGARSHVDDAVGGHHDGRVVLHHHQRVAGVAQPVHGLRDAGMSRGCRPMLGSSSTNSVFTSEVPSAGGQVDALHLAAGQRAALPVQRQVADARRPPGTSGAC